MDGSIISKFRHFSPEFSTFSNEVGRCIGGIFSCEEYRGTIGSLNEKNILNSIDEFLHHSTLVPFNLWDPRFRMQPAPLSSEVPKWLDGDGIRREGLGEHHSVEGGILSDIKNKIPHYRKNVEIQTVKSQ